MKCDVSHSTSVSTPVPIRRLAINFRYFIIVVNGLLLLFERVGFGEFSAVAEPLNYPQQCNDADYGYGYNVEEAKSQTVDRIT
jgi:hypothetical protein